MSQAWAASTRWADAAGEGAGWRWRDHGAHDSSLVAITVCIFPDTLTPKEIIHILGESRWGLFVCWPRSRIPSGQHPGIGRTSWPLVSTSSAGSASGSASSGAGFFDHDCVRVAHDQRVPGP